jgi:hypothetical protein
MFKIEENSLLGHWAIENAIKLIPSADLYSETQQARIISFFGRIQVKKIQDLWDKRQKKWKNFDNKLNRIRRLIDWVNEAIRNLLKEFQTAKGISIDRETDTNNLRWQTNKAKGIKISASKVYHIMLNSKNKTTDINRWWNL